MAYYGDGVCYLVTVLTGHKIGRIGFPMTAVPNNDSKQGYLNFFTNRASIR